MEDKQIVQLYLDRDESAITQTDKKYGVLCRKIAFNILFNAEDSEECVNDAYLSAWNSIPPNIPVRLSAYLAKITRGLSISRLRANTAKKRSLPDSPFEEISECTAGKGKIYEKIEAEELAESIQRFLEKQNQEVRNIFISRYFYCCSIEEISRKFHVSQSKVKTALFRSRTKLRAYLIKEGLLDD